MSLWEIIQWVKRDKANDLAQVRAAAEEWREIKEEYKQEVQELRQENEEMKDILHEHKSEIKEYQQEIISLTKQNRDYLEELIFLRKMKNN